MCRKARSCALGPVPPGVGPIVSAGWRTSRAVVRRCERKACPGSAGAFCSIPPTLRRSGEDLSRAAPAFAPPLASAATAAFQPNSGAAIGGKTSPNRTPNSTPKRAFSQGALNQQSLLFPIDYGLATMGERGFGQGLPVPAEADAFGRKRAIKLAPIRFLRGAPT